MKRFSLNNERGFSLIGLLVAMTVTLILLGIVHGYFAGDQRQCPGIEKSRCLVSAQAALNVLSREIGNSGFGLFTDSQSQTPNNGIVLADSNKNQNPACVPTSATWGTTLAARGRPCDQHERARRGYNVFLRQRDKINRAIRCPCGLRYAANIGGSKQDQ